MSEHTPIKILEQAVSDVGYWRYWVRGEDSIQLEFGGTQIYTASNDPGKPPSGLLAIRLSHPLAAVALTRSQYEGDPPSDWFSQLGADQIDPFTVEYGSLSLSDRDQMLEIIEASSSQHWIIGESPDLLVDQSQWFVSFWAQNVGFAAVAESVSFLTMSGELAEQDIESRHTRWWEYWHEYWQRRDTEDPMPQDYACEVTIPAG